MTWAEKEVLNLELYKRLKELGYPQESSGGWYWSRWYVNEPFRVIFSLDGEKFCEWVEGDYVEYHPPIEKYKAPTCREIAFWITKGVSKMIEKASSDLRPFFTLLKAKSVFYWENSPDDYAEDLI